MPEKAAHRSYSRLWNRCPCWLARRAITHDRAYPTGSRVILPPDRPRFDRERLWYELFHARFDEADLERVNRYLPRGTPECRSLSSYPSSCNSTASKRI
jgi:hypothetical protein